MPGPGGRSAGGPGLVARRAALLPAPVCADETAVPASQRGGVGVRVPCRAETMTPFSCGESITTDLANYCGEHTYRSESKGVYRHGTTDVGSFPPNAFGLCDMHGNVWEWCADAWHDDYTGAPVNSQAWAGARDAHSAARVLRGGCWHDPPDLSRSAARLKQDAREAEDFFGLRVALTTLG